MKITTQSIAAEFLQPYSKTKHPLPIGASWNNVIGDDLFGADVQLQKLLAGAPVFVTFKCPQPGLEQKQYRPDSRNGKALADTCAAGAPITIWFPQPYSDLLEAFPSADAQTPTSRQIDFIDNAWRYVPKTPKKDGTIPEYDPVWLTGLGETQPWQNLGSVYGKALAFLATIYPAPPAILLLDNGELLTGQQINYKKLFEKQTDTALPAYMDPRLVDFETSGSLTIMEQRHILNVEWTKRMQAFWGCLIAELPDAWQKVAETCAYKTGPEPGLGRSDYGILADGPSADGKPPAWIRTNNFYLVDGIEAFETVDRICVNTYEHDFAGYQYATDCTVKSIQMDATATAIQVEEIQQALREKGADGRIAIASWDGNNNDHTPGNGTKMRAYEIAGAGDSPPERLLGSMRDRLWTYRPSLVLPFHNSQLKVSANNGHIDAEWKACAEVWTNPTLRRFWRDGEPVLNTMREHPYGRFERWTGKRMTLLNTDKMPVDLGVPKHGQVSMGPYARAWRLGNETLLLVTSPREAVSVLTITLPTGTVGVDVPREGRFWLLAADGTLRDCTDDVDISESPQLPDPPESEEVVALKKKIADLTAQLRDTSSALQRAEVDNYELTAWLASAKAEVERLLPALGTALEEVAAATSQVQDLQRQLTTHELVVEELRSRLSEIARLAIL